MTKEHIFYDYIDLSRQNVIDDWLDNGGSDARVGFIIRIELLSSSPPGGIEESVWKPPFVLSLKGQWKKYDDFVEIRVKAKKRQFRLIGKKIDREIFLTGWGFHDGKGWNTSITPATAQERVDLMIGNPNLHRRKHEI